MSLKYDLEDDMNAFDVEFEKALDELEERQKNKRKYSFSVVNVGTIAATQPAHKRMKPDQLPHSPCTMPTVAQSLHARAQKHHAQQLLWQATHCAKCQQHNTKCICDIREHNAIVVVCFLVLSLVFFLLCFVFLSNCV